MGIIWIGVGFVTGTVLGSFVKVLADRSLTKGSFRGRSYCTQCKQNLAWYDLLPIVSYLILKGECRYCKKKIGVEYLVVEAGMGLLIAVLFWQSDNLKFEIFNLNSNFKFKILISLSDLLFKVFFVSTLAVLFITDLKKMFIPDRITYPAIAVTLIYMVAITAVKIGYLFYYLSQTRIGQLLLPPYSDYFQRHAVTVAYPLLGGVAMALLIGGFFTLLIFVTRGRGMGGGDVKLGAFIGLALGFPNALIALILSFFSGAVVSLGLLALKKKHFGQSVPFGPFLVFGSLVTLFWGKQILDWYLSLSF